MTDEFTSTNTSFTLRNYAKKWANIYNKSLKQSLAQNMESTANSNNNLTREFNLR